MLRVVLFIFCLSAGLQAQETQLVFTPILDGKVLDFSGADPDRVRGASARDAEQVGGSRAVTVETLRFYLSQVVLLKDGAIVHRAAKKHHLLDAERPETLRLPLSTVADYDELRFTLGIDSLTAAAGVFGGDLDPTNGMYWTWRSGYINFKLEGTSPDCPARKNRFQFHVGGFQAPFNSEREVRLQVSMGSTIPIQIDLDRFFTQIDLQKEYQVMSPNIRSMALGDLLVGLFNNPR